MEKNKNEYDDENFQQPMEILTSNLTKVPLFLEGERTKRIPNKIKCKTYENFYRFLCLDN